MKKNKMPIIGIDVSKDTFDAYSDGVYSKYANSKKGWQKFWKAASSCSVCAMEATGNYHYKLAAFLHSKGIGVKVFNPLRVCRYMQSLGLKAKTDKGDSERIALYAATESAKAVPYWMPMPSGLARARAIVSLLHGLSKLERACGNMNHAAKLVLDKTDRLLGVMPDVSSLCKEQQESLEDELCEIAGEMYPDDFRLLQTIPGIGRKSAAVLLVSVKDMRAFESGDRLASFIGLAPTVKESGTSVKGKGRIAKVGNTYLRSLLFMCAFSAVQFNKPCSELYDRLAAKGKSRTLAQVAVMHRLVKIAFGVVKSGEPFRGGRIEF